MIKKITTLNSVYYVEDNKVTKIETDNWRSIHDQILQDPQIYGDIMVGDCFRGDWWHSSLVKSIEEIENI